MRSLVMVSVHRPRWLWTLLFTIAQPSTGAHGNLPGYFSASGEQLISTQSCRSEIYEMGLCALR